MSRRSDLMEITMKKLIDVVDPDGPDDLKLELACKLVALSLEWAKAPREERDKVLRKGETRIKNWIKSVYLPRRKK